MGPQLEKWIIEGSAEPKIVSLGLSGLSSFALDPLCPFIITQIQVFPFFDIDQNETDVGPITPHKRVQRAVHYYEISNGKKIFGFTQRSAFRMEPDLGSVIVPTPVVPIPCAGADVLTCFIVLTSGGNVVMRVMRIPAPGETGITVGFPPPDEISTPGGYAAGVSVVQEGLSYGLPPENYVPDITRVSFAAPPITNMRPRPVTANLAVRIANAGNSFISAFSYPLVNLVGYQLKDEELLRAI